MYNSNYNYGLFVDALKKFCFLYETLMDLYGMVYDNPDYPEQSGELFDLAEKVHDLSKYFLEDIMK